MTVVIFKKKILISKNSYLKYVFQEDGRSASSGSSTSSHSYSAASAASEQLDGQIPQMQLQNNYYANMGQMGQMYGNGGYCQPIEPQGQLMGEWDGMTWNPQMMPSGGQEIWQQHQNPLNM